MREWVLTPSRRNYDGQEPKLKVFRAIAIFLTQLPIILFWGGTHDLLLGFNQTHAGLGTLLILFVSVPLLNLSWLIIEIRLLVKQSKLPRKTLSFLIPFIPLIFLMESIAIDLYLLSTVRM